MKNMNIKTFKYILVSAITFCYSVLTINLAQADDLEIYTKAATSGSGGDPVLMFVIDTSGSMYYDMANDNGASNILNERMFQLQNTLRDQFTSMKGNFSAGLFSYDYPDSGTLEKEAIPLSTMITSTIGGAGIPASGTYSEDVEDDVAQILGQGVRNGEDQLGLPWNVNDGGTSSLGSSVTGTWTSSGGPSSNPSTAGNFVVEYVAESDWSQTFWLERDGNGTTPDPYMYLLDENDNVIASNDNASAPTAGCPASAPEYDWASGQCFEWEQYCSRYKRNGSCRRWSWRETNWTAPVLSGGNIDSTITNISLTNGKKYRVVVATAAGGQSGGWTLRVTRDWRGYFYQSLPASKDEQRVGLRFPTVDVPAGATITSAYLEFEVDEASPTGATLAVGIDDSLTPAEFGVADLQDGSRALTFKSAVVLPTQSNGAIFQLDVTNLMTNQIKQAAWCGGEDVVFVIKNGGVSTDTVIVESEEDNDEPKLVVNYTTTGTGACFAKTLNIDIEGIGEDVEQDASGNMTIDDNDITFSGQRKGGLRFSLISLPPATVANGLVVSSAYLSLTAKNDTDPGTIYITSIAEDIAQVFDGANGSLDIRALGDTVEWVPGNWTTDTRYTSPDLSSIIQPRLNSEGWEYQGTLGFIISSSNLSSSEFYAWEYVSSNQARNYGDSFNWNAFGTQSASLEINVNSSEPIESGLSARKERVDDLITFIPYNGTPIAGSYVEAAEYMLGKGSYASPLDNSGSCQSNTLILLTDGEESGSYSSSDFNAITGGSCSGSWNCNYALASKLKDGAVSYDDALNKTIKTYTIGYGPIAASGGGELATVANRGDGQYYAATDASALASAFTSIVGSVSDSGTSIAVPGVAVSAFNRTTLLDEVYYGLFKPSTKVKWPGNLKRYRISDNTIRDVNDLDAIEEGSVFKETAQSWWSAVVDGTVVYSGGAAEEITGNRKIYTFLGTYGTDLGTNSNGDPADVGVELSELVTTSNTNIGADDLGIDRLAGFGGMTGVQIAALRTEVLEWAAGGTVTNPRKEWGAPVHASPVMVGYKEVSGNLVSTVYTSTNEGYLHATDSGEPSTTGIGNRGGNELFSFMPRETLRNAALLEENAEGDMVYGLDNTWTLRRDSGSNNLIDDNDDSVYLYGSMRRGGRMIYALNVTDSYYGGATKPKLMWAIGNETEFEDGLGGTESEYDMIGQTWSKPRIKYVSWKGEKQLVALFGGGYDPAHDTVSHTGTDTYGNQIFMVDAVSGELLWSTKTDNSITAGISPYDRDGDGLFDSFYAVDLAGRVLRYDQNGDKFEGHTIAALGASGGGDNRRFYETPEIALQYNMVTKEIDMMIAVGSGYRAHPGDDTTQERFYVIYDRGAGGAAKLPPVEVISHSTNLVKVDVGTGISKKELDANNIYTIDGWYYDFDSSIAEKSLGAPVIYNGYLFFTSYNVKVSGVTTCTPVLGNTRLYIMTIAGKGAAEVFGGTVGAAYLDDVSSGMAPDVQVINEGGNSALLNDKQFFTTAPGFDCVLKICGNKDLMRGSWYTKTNDAPY